MVFQKMKIGWFSGILTICKIVRIQIRKMKSQFWNNYRYHIGWLPSQGKNHFDHGESVSIQIQRGHPPACLS